MRRGTGFAIAAGIACAALSTATEGAVANAYRVTAGGDPAPGACTRPHCSLREAVIAANSHPGADVILLRPGKTYRMALPGTGEDAAATGDLDITDSLTIKRDRPRTRRERRRRRLCPLPPLPCKGPLALVNGGELDSVFETHGELTTTFDGINVRQGKAPPAHDGGIDVDAGTARIIRSVVGGNRGGDDGGIGTSDATLIIKRSRIDSNRTAGDVGGIDANGDGLKLVRSLVFNNSGPGSGGGVFVGERGFISKTEIVLNATGAVGGGIVNATATTTVADSAIYANGAESGGGIATGGSSSDSLTVRNSTVVDNSATQDGGGISNAGGSASLNNVTVARNQAQSDGLGPVAGGGGLYTTGGPGFTVRNSLIALNTVGSPGFGPDCAGTFSSGGHNLLSFDAGCAGFTGAGDFVSVNPKLEKGKPSTRDHGGPTETLALLRGSPAINKGGADAEKRDQRGVRKVGRRDIGAYEFVPRKRRRR